MWIPKIELKSEYIMDFGRSNNINISINNTCFYSNYTNDRDRITKRCKKR